MLQQTEGQVRQTVDGLQALHKREALLACPAAEGVVREPVWPECNGLHACYASDVIDVRVQVLQVGLARFRPALVDQPAEEVQSNHAAVRSQPFELVVGQVLWSVRDLLGSGVAVRGWLLTELEYFQPRAMRRVRSVHEDAETVQLAHQLFPELCQARIGGADIALTGWHPVREVPVELHLAQAQAVVAAK